MSVIDEYLTRVSPSQRAGLERLRTIVTASVPEAQEVISYGMPGFKYRNKYLAGFKAFKDHLSFFPTARPIEVNKKNLKGYKISKGTIQFSPDKPIPESIIKELLRVRVADIDK